MEIASDIYKIKPEILQSSLGESCHAGLDYLLHCY